MYPKAKQILLLLPFLAITLFQHFEFLSIDVQGIHVWRQSATMWNIRNFARHDANILNPRQSHFNGVGHNIVRLEFPITQWGIGMLQRLFGERIEIVRLSVFVIGVFALLGMFFIVNLVTQNWISALFTAVLFQYAPVFYYYTINPLPDILALSASLWYLFFILQYYQLERKTKYILFASLFLSLATLAKLPFLMFSMVSIYFFINDIWKNGFKKGFKKENFIAPMFQFVGIIPAIAWYAWVIPTWAHSQVLTGIFSEGLFTKRNGFILDYHLNTMFPRLLLSPPVWLLAIVGLFLFLIRFSKLKLQWLWSLIGITFLYLLLEFNTIADIHDYYMLPFLPWLYLLIGLGIHTIQKLHRFAIVIPIILTGFSINHTPQFISNYWSVNWAGDNKDVYIYSEQLKKAAPQDALCIFMNDPTNALFSYKVDKMGYFFQQDYLPAPWVGDMIENYNVKYLYSNSEKVNTDPEMQQYFDTLLLKAGSIKVFKLIPPKE